MIFHDFTAMLGWDRPAILKRLSQIHGEVASAYEELGFSQVAEARAKAQGFMGSEQTTVTGRERDATYNALDATCEVFSLKGQIAALIEERELLKVLLAESQPAVVLDQ